MLVARGAGEMSTACVIVPTYNEAQNIVAILDRVFENEREQPAIGHRWSLSVLVVDDSSPDGTAALVSAYRLKNPDVHLLTREKKEGLGAAYTAGMRHAMAMLAPDVIMEMDADFSHNPDDIIRLLDETRKGADFVIGSRYVEGGSIPENWGAHRRAISKLANLYTKTVLSIRDVRDCSGGFRAMKTSLLKKIDFSTLNVKGYVFQVSLLDAALRAGAVVREIPIAFSERLAGKSKMRITDMAEGGVALLRLRMGRIFSPGEAPRLEEEEQTASAALEESRQGAET